jgi:hypothetical protein
VASADWALTPPVDEAIVAVGSSLHEAARSIEESFEYGRDLLPVAETAAIVVEQIENIKALLALIEHETARSHQATPAA